MRYLIFATIILLYSCDKDVIKREEVIKDLKIKKIVFVPENPTDESFVVIPEYNIDGTLKLTKTVFSLNETDTLIDQIIENDRAFKITFYNADSPFFSNYQPYRNIIFNYTNGRLDSIEYNEKISIPYQGIGVSKRIYEYENNIIKREYNLYFYQEGEKDERKYKSINYNSEGNVVSYIADSSEFIYDRTDFTYFEPSKWNVQGFNLYYFQYGYSGQGLLYAAQVYFYPLLFSKLRFMNNQPNALIKTVRYSGYYYESGEKITYDRTGDVGYILDSKGRVIEMNNNYDSGEYIGKFRIEYTD